MSDRQANPTVAPPGRGTHCDSGGGEEASNASFPAVSGKALQYTVNRAQTANWEAAQIKVASGGD